VDLCAKGRTSLKLDLVLAALRDDARIVLHDFTAAMALATAQYAALPDIHDRCIVAATVKLMASRRDVLLVTRDQAIRDSGLAPTLWE